MRIALCQEYSACGKGGTEVLVSELATRLSSNHKVILVSEDDATSLERAGLAPFIAEHIPFKRPLTSRSGAIQLAEKIARCKPDIAHFHFGGVYGWGNRLPYHCPTYFLRRRGVPCVSTVHLVVNLFNGYCGPTKPGWFKALMFPFAWAGKLQQLRSVSREVAVSQHDLEKLRRWYWPARGRFTQIYHSRITSPTSVNTGNRDPVILNVGHIAWRKGQEVLAEAFGRIAPQNPQWTLQLAGSGSDDSVRKIRQVEERYQIQGRILLLGERSDAIDLMQKASIYVQPSFWEALGLALQEAMFAGCASIGSRAGGIPELIDDRKTGLLFEPGNVDQLAQMIQKLITDETTRKQLGMAAAASIRQRGMTAEKMTESYLKLYESISR